MSQIPETLELCFQASHPAALVSAFFPLLSQLPLARPLYSFQNFVALFLLFKSLVNLSCPAQCKKLLVHHGLLASDSFLSVLLFLHSFAVGAPLEQNTNRPRCTVSSALKMSRPWIEWFLGIYTSYVSIFSIRSVILLGMCGVSGRSISERV